MCGHYCHPGRECVNITKLRSIAVVSDLTDPPNPSFTADSTRIVVEGISLTMEDKMILASNKWLSDSHVSAAQFLLKKQHPNIYLALNLLLCNTREHAYALDVLLPEVRY